MKLDWVCFVAISLGFLVDDRGVQNVAHLVNGIKNLSVLFFARLKYLGVCEGTRVQLQTLFTMFWALTKIIMTIWPLLFFCFGNMNFYMSSLSFSLNSFSETIATVHLNIWSSVHIWNWNIESGHNFFMHVKSLTYNRSSLHWCIIFYSVLTTDNFLL